MFVGDQVAEGEPQVIKFAFAPEAVWDMMKENGTIAKWEKENNVRIETSTKLDVARTIGPFVKDVPGNDS